MYDNRDTKNSRVNVLSQQTAGMGMAGAACAQSAGGSQVKDALIDLAGAVDRLESTVTSLGGKLYSVLLQMDAAPTNQVNEKLTRARVPLAEDLAVMDCRIRTIGQTLDNILARLEL